MKATCDNCRMSTPTGPCLLTIAKCPISEAVQTDMAIDKATWWGCGKHIPNVMDQIPENERCTCTPQVEVEGKKYPPKGPKAD